MLFTRDVRVRDLPALAAAHHDADQILPLFVLDPRLLARSANRSRFLLEALADLDHALGRRGARLVVRHGDAAEVAIREAVRWKCRAVYLSRDVTAFARRRAASLRDAGESAGVEVREFPGHAVVEPGAAHPASQPAYRVFTPYLRAWLDAPRRDRAPTPRALTPVPRVPHGTLPSPAAARPSAGRLPLGGETAGRARMQRFLAGPSSTYGQRRDQLGDDSTSGLSPYLRFGCISAAELDERARERDAGAFRRQLGWRDFFLQLLAAWPSLATDDLRPGRSPRWRDDAYALRGWCSATTGEPLVDAAMRQLHEEGWIPNRARLIAASYLTRTLGIDWRSGAEHFFTHLVDGDPASNAGNWQWVAGTGANPRRGQALSMERQAKRFDADGRYRSRWAVAASR